MRRTPVAAIVLLQLFSACYVYRPTPRAPASGDRVELFLNNDGRAALGKVVGEKTRIIAGAVTDAGDSSLVLSVRSTTSVAGDYSEWTGEKVTVGTALLDSVRVRKLSGSRTALAAAGGIAAAAIVQALFSHGTTGGPGGQRPTPPQ